MSLTLTLVASTCPWPWEPAVSAICHGRQQYSPWPAMTLSHQRAGLGHQGKMTSFCSLSISSVILPSEQVKCHFYIPSLTSILQCLADLISNRPLLDWKAMQYDNLFDLNLWETWVELAALKRSHMTVLTFSHCFATLRRWLVTRYWHILWPETITQPHSKSVSINMSP